MDRADELRELASQVGQIAYRVHEYFGNGLLEKVYESALEHRLIKAGCKVELNYHIFGQDFCFFSVQFAAEESVGNTKII